MAQAAHVQKIDGSSEMSVALLLTHTHGGWGVGTDGTTMSDASHVRTTCVMGVLVQEEANSMAISTLAKQVRGVVALFLCSFKMVCLCLQGVITINRSVM